MSMAFCCEQMKRQVGYTCDVHPDLSECPDFVGGPS